MNVLELFEHRYNKGQKFSWLEMIDFAQAYASQSKEECANYARCKAVTDGEIVKEREIRLQEHFPVFNQIDAKNKKDKRYIYGLAFEDGVEWMREQQGEGDVKINVPIKGLEFDFEKGKVREVSKVAGFTEGYEQGLEHGKHGEGAKEDYVLDLINFASALDNYIKFLGYELDETAVLAHTHGWRSGRVKEGERLRAELKRLKAKVGLTDKQ